MAKYERRFKGDFDNFVNFIERKVVSDSSSAHLEESSDFLGDNVKVSVRVFERYSAFSKSRVSLNVTMVSNDDYVYVTAIPSGGSQAMFFKIDTVGESNFLSKFEKAADEYIHANRID